MLQIYYPFAPATMPYGGPLSLSPAEQMAGPLPLPHLWESAIYGRGGGDPSKVATLHYVLELSPN